MEKETRKRELPESQPLTGKDDTEKKPTEETHEDKKPKTLKWGNKSLLSRITQESTEKKGGLFGCASGTTMAGKESAATDTSEAPTLKWGNGKSSLLEKADLKSSMAIPQSASVETTQTTTEAAHATTPKTQDDPDNIVVRVRVYELVEREFKSRGKGLLKVIRFPISFASEESATKYQIVFRREGEEGGTGTVLVFNSLLYPSTPVKEVENGYLLITLPETESKLTSYLLKAVDETKTKKLMEDLEHIIHQL